MYRASGEVFQSLKPELLTPIALLVRTNSKVSVIVALLVLLLELFAALLPWYSDAQKRYYFVFLFCVCQEDWDKYCRGYPQLVNDCSGIETPDCTAYNTDWKAGKITLCLFLAALALMFSSVINSCVKLRKPDCCSIQIPASVGSVFCAAAGVAVWLTLSRYKRGPDTEVELGMSLGLMAVILGAGQVMHSLMLRTEVQEFQEATETADPGINCL